MSEVGKKPVPKDWRRALLKISTSIMISIVGPASAWAYNEHLGLFTYICIYILCKFLISYFASRTSQRAIFAHRYSPILLAIAGILAAVLAQSELISLYVIPLLLGGYEGAYWTGYWDLKGDEKKPMGIFNPAEEGLKKAAMISKPFAISQFVIVNAMRFGALQRGIFWLGALVVASELLAHVVTTVYTKNNKRPSEANRKLWNLGQMIFLVSSMMMMAGLIFEIFWLFVFGWIVAQGTARGILRKIEVLFASAHMGKPRSLKQVDAFQTMEVIAAVIAVVVTIGLEEQQALQLDPALLATLIAISTYLLPYKNKIFNTNNEAEDNYQIGLRERMKFQSHLYLVVLLLSIVFYLNPAANTIAYVLLIIGFFVSVLGVVWADYPLAYPPENPT